MENSTLIRNSKPDVNILNGSRCDWCNSAETKLYIVHLYDRTYFVCANCFDERFKHAKLKP